MILKEKCSTCGRHDIQTQMLIGKKNYVIFKCGHVNSTILAPDDPLPPPIYSGPDANGTSTQVDSTSTQVDEPELLKSDLALIPEEIEPPENPNYISCDGSMLSYDYQTDGVHFIEQTGHRCLIADATGLGKTIQALLAIRESGLKTLILVKSTLIYQWSEEYRRWKDATPFKVMPVITRDQLIPGFDSYVMSMDLFGRMKPKDLLKLNSLGIECIILDEVHNYKNPETSRAKNLISFVQMSGLEKIIALSATPIKNRADEYFTILNLLDPARFNSPQNFRYSWLCTNDKGQYARIDPFRLDKFKELTSRYILRREKHDVLTNLPPLSRNFVYVEIEDEEIKKSYNTALDLFSNFLNDKTVNSTQMLGWLAKLRAITGQAKCQNAIDFAQEFLDSTDESLTIGINHISVRDTIKYVFLGGGYSCESLSGEDSSWHKSRVVQRFQNGDFRLLVLNMKSGGEGLNLQNCATALVLERAWNAADEEQFEGRFHRNGQAQAVSVTYFIARGTVDQFFHDMVAKKRQIVGETLSKDWNFESDSDSIRELSEIIVRHKL